MGDVDSFKKMNCMMMLANLHFQKIHTDFMGINIDTFFFVSSTEDMFEYIRNPALYQMHTSPNSLCWKFHLQCGGSVSHGG